MKFIAIVIGLAALSANAEEPDRGSLDRRVLPILDESFDGVIQPGSADSIPSFPAKVQAPAGAPNVLLVMTDDVGFAASSTYGGPVPTPTLEDLARRGIAYTRFHTTAMCSPTRAALLTGRNSHVAGTGTLTDFATGFPGYLGEIPRTSATIAEILRQNGYATAMFGKHHNVPISELSTAGPFDNWPTGLGFEYFYGFIGAQTDQWHPALVRGTQYTSAPADQHLDKLLVSDAIRWLHNQNANDPRRPFFIYLAPGTAHAPLQAPQEWIEKFRGQFEGGWDEARQRVFERQKASGIIPATTILTPRPSFLPAWDSLTEAQQKIAARLMEVFAAQLAYQDHELGRLVDEIRRMGLLEQTLIIYIQGDNGGSSEGGPLGTSNDVGRLVNQVPESEEWVLEHLDDLGGPEMHAQYPMSWAWVTNTPFRYFKRYASHLGGIRNGMVISWPRRMSKTGLRRDQFLHIIDIAPTILEAASVPAPGIVNGVRQRPMDGRSILKTFDSPTAEVRSTQYFEILGNRAIFDSGWMASSTPPEAALATDINDRGTLSPLDYDWELYDLRSDYSQSTDLASKHPEKLQVLREVWTREAHRNHVFPLDSSLSAARLAAEQTARLPLRNRYVYWGKGVELERGSMPPILGRSFSLRAELDVPTAATTGVIAAVGDRLGGWAFYLKDGRPQVHESYSAQPDHQYTLAAAETLPPGPATVDFRVRYSDQDRSAIVSISINGGTPTVSAFANRVNMVHPGEIFAIGRDAGMRVTNEYPGEGEFPGSIHRVNIDFD